MLQFMSFPQTLAEELINSDLPGPVIDISASASEHLGQRMDHENTPMTTQNNSRHLVSRWWHWLDVEYVKPLFGGSGTTTSSDQN